MGWVSDMCMNLILQVLDVFSSERVVVNLHEVIVDGSIGALGRADCHGWKVQVSYWMSRNRGCHGRCLPGRVRTVDQIKGSNKAQKDNHAPGNFTNFALGEVLLRHSIIIGNKCNKRYVL